MIICGKMQLFSNQVNEYQKRHNELWPEMKDVLLTHGLKNYYIFFDKDTNILFSFVDVDNKEKWDEVAKTEPCKKWWTFMKDIMVTNSDNSPVFQDLKLVFELHK